MTTLSYFQHVSDWAGYPYSPAIAGTVPTQGFVASDGDDRPPVAAALHAPSGWSDWVEKQDGSDTPWALSNTGFKTFVATGYKVDCADVVWRITGKFASFANWHGYDTRVLVTDDDVQFYNDTVDNSAYYDMSGSPEWGAGFRPRTVVMPNQFTYLDRAQLGAGMAAGDEAAVELYVLPAATPGDSPFRYSGYCQPTYATNTWNFDSTYDKLVYGFVDASVDAMAMTVADIRAGYYWDGSTLKIVRDGSALYTVVPDPSATFRRLQLGDWNWWNFLGPLTDLDDPTQAHVFLQRPTGSGSSQFTSTEDLDFFISAANLKFVAYHKVSAGAVSPEDIYVDMGLLAVPSPHPNPPQPTPSPYSRGGEPLPDFQGLAWDVSLGPSFSTTVVTGDRGQEYRKGTQALPTWRFSQRYEFLRQRLGEDEWATLCGFVAARRGSFESFYYLNPLDNSVDSYQFATGDGSRKDFQLYRLFCGFAEPTQNVKEITLLTVGGDPVSSADGYVDGEGVLHLLTAPDDGAALVWSGTFYYRCRFDVDETEFSEFMAGLFSLDRLGFYGAPGNMV